MNSFNLRASDLDLALTLGSGQVFHWRCPDRVQWEGCLGMHFFRLARRAPSTLSVHTTAEPAMARSLLRNYFGLNHSLRSIVNTFPSDPLMQASLQANVGLRLLAQDAWVALACFILSSTKQIIQIRQMVQAISQAFGAEVTDQSGQLLDHSFPTPGSLARAGESALRACRMGYRARFLHQTACLIDQGKFDLVKVGQLALPEAREALMQLPGVGPKIADCVLLFGYGFQSAFPLDVWMIRILRDYYFPGQSPSVKALQAFANDYFGRHAGYAQQYLFDHVRALDASTWKKLVSDSPFIPSS